MREPRLGDDIDDYCVRCKRIMNHAVVSVVNGAPAKVRCRTCYNDHDYRHEQAPPKADTRKSALFQEVLQKVRPDAGAAAVEEAEAEAEAEAGAQPDEVDELGYPLNEPEAEPGAAPPAKPAPLAKPAPAAKPAKPAPKPVKTPPPKAKSKAKPKPKAQAKSRRP